MPIADLASLISALATSVLAVATTVVGFATLRYAKGTNSLAEETRRGVEAQVVASQALITANNESTRISVRAHVVSNTRLAWMDAVSDAVAELLSIDAEIKDPMASTLEREFLDNLVQCRLMILYRIEFRLDPEKSHHQELFSCISKLVVDESVDVAVVARVRKLTILIREEGWRRVRQEVGALASASAELYLAPTDAELTPPAATPAVPAGRA